MNAKKISKQQRTQTFRLVLESISKLEDDRRCWRLVNGVLFEKAKKEVVPELQQMIANLGAVVKQLNDALLLKK